METGKHWKKSRKKTDMAIRASHRPSNCRIVNKLPKKIAYQIQVKLVTLLYQLRMKLREMQGKKIRRPIFEDIGLVDDFE
ncbi:hypothetical protein JTE90_008940 [Oedothorax gibbosus]|uniref:Uncharacterized protein n=1 Tax=Oedothorax gibbosus TaxID=931172 RepID=A0AAV6UMJ8_9ARAC|nr:hypothetical protein JTE90_008940 [Oedothorax gibbosus]